MQQDRHSPTSSKTSQSESFRVAETRLGSIENSTPDTSKSVKLCIFDPTTPTNPASGSTQYTRACSTSTGEPSSMTVTLSGVLRFFHIENFLNASEADAMFLYSLWFLVRSRSKVLARESNGECDRVYKALVAAMVEMCEEAS